MRNRFVFTWLLLLSSSSINSARSVVAEKIQQQWGAELPEDEVFWGMRGLMGDTSMSFLAGGCEQVDTSVVCLASESGLGDKLTDCNTIEASGGDECNRFPVYIHSIENNGGNDIEIANLNVKRDGDTSKTINTQTILAGESIRLIEERIGGSIDFCEKERIVTKTIVEAEEPKSCEDSAAYTFGAPPTPPSPTLPPTRFSYQLDTPGFEEDRLTNFTDCSSRDFCDADSLCGFSGYAADAEFGAEDWIEATRGTKADCNVPGFDYYLLEGPYCPPDSRCSGRCHIELICTYDDE